MKVQLPPLDVGIILKFGFIFVCVLFAAWIGTSCSFLESTSIALVAFVSAVFLNKTEQVLRPIKNKVKSALQVETTPHNSPTPTPHSSPATPHLNSDNDSIDKQEDGTPSKVIRVNN